MSTGENFMRIAWNRRVKPISVSKELARSIDSQIEKLQLSRDALYLDDELTDDELYAQVKIIDTQIIKLIDSKY